MMATTAPMEPFEFSAVAAKFRQLDNVPAPSPWDPLSVYIVDINNSPEQYLKTVEVVVSSRPPSSIVLLYNMEGLDISVKEGYWPNYRIVRDDSGIVAQVHNKIKVEELSGFPQQLPITLQTVENTTWLCVEKDGARKTVVGLTVVKEDVPESSVELHTAACFEVVRGKMGAEVDVMVYTNKQLNTVSEDTGIVRDMVLTSWQAASLFTSSQEIESRKLFDGGIVLKSPVSDKHKRKKLYVEYLKIRDQLLLSPHEYGLDISIQAGGDADITIIENGVVEILCKPGEEKNFKLVLRNALPEVHEEVQGVSSIVIEDCGPLKETDDLELSDEHKLCHGGDNKIRLKPGKKYKVSVKTKGGEIGQIKIPLMVGYYHESRSTTITRDDGQTVFQLSRMAVELLIKTQTEEIAELKPVTEYIPVLAPRQLCRASEIVKGKPLPKLDSNDGLEIKLPLAPTHPSRVRKTVINTRLQQVGTHKDEMIEFMKCKNLVKDGLTPQNYADRWEFLLHCERLQEEKDIRHFDLTGKELKVQRNSGLILLEVPGLAESRPSVLKGDRLFIRESGRGTVEYEGVVHYVGDKNVSLGLSDKLVSKLNSARCINSWDVRFSFSPFTHDTMHRAVKMAAGLPNLFFPFADSLRIEPIQRPIEIECFDDRVSTNPEQLAAVQAIVEQTSGSAPFIVFGPPGTGKTVTLVEAIKQVWQLNPSTHILVCAPSNTAADLLTVRLSHHVPREEMMRLIAYSRPVENVPDSVRVYSNLGPGGYEFPNLETMVRYRIIITTLVTAGKLVSAQFPRDHFGHVFIDEAGQATEPETVIALGGILSSEGRLVMAGDPYQLGPIVRSSLANQHGLSRSLLERLINSTPYVNPGTGDFDGRCIKKLVRNFRSHQALLELPGRLYYKAELQPCAPAALVSGCLKFPGLTDTARGVTPIIVHGVVGQDMREGNSPSFFNPEELFIVVDYVKKLLEFKVDEDDIGIITPYRGQVQKLKWRLEERNMSDITVGTTEEFQGQERKVIIVSTVRSSPEYVTLDQRHRLGFLADSKRFNVAITRSQALLIVVGNPHILYQDKNWRELLDHARSLDCYKGCKFPEEEEMLGKMETKLDTLLREEAGDRARVEEMGMKARN